MMSAVPELQYSANHLRAQKNDAKKSFRIFSVPEFSHYTSFKRTNKSWTKKNT